MINSGALPNVALSRPPIASPVRVAICSVATTIRRAIGTIAIAAEKNNTGSGTCAYSSAREIGMNTKSQLIEGFSMSGLRAPRLCRQAVHHGEKEARGPAAHQDPGQGLDAPAQPPAGGQDDVAVAGGGVGD